MQFSPQYGLLLGSTCIPVWVCVLKGKLWEDVVNHKASLDEDYECTNLQCQYWAQVEVHMMKWWKVFGLPPFFIRPNIVVIPPRTMIISDLDNAAFWAEGVSPSSFLPSCIGEEVEDSSEAGLAAPVELDELLLEIQGCSTEGFTFTSVTFSSWHCSPVPWDGEFICSWSVYNHESCGSREENEAFAFIGIVLCLCLVEHSRVVACVEKGIFNQTPHWNRQSKVISPFLQKKKSRKYPFSCWSV